MVGVLVIDMRKRSYPPIWLLFEQGCVQVAAGASFAVDAGGCCDLACRQDPAMSDVRPHRRLRLPRLRPWSRPAGSGRFCEKWAPISSWVPDFCAVFGGVCPLSALPTWGNADAGWRFGPILPAKPPRSCKWGSLALKVAHEAVQLRRRKGDAEHVGASAECGDRNTLVE